ncbi:toll/interleukin-1 receptor domain-containing protein [Sphingomonas sp. 2378]|uniref:toll/interleukin-1 receptor domain-containing protein n=1 Tax=Sphingomonas sp. 2378 TaxID=1219748 RepID=UPI00311B360E
MALAGSDPYLWIKHCGGSNRMKVFLSHQHGDKPVVEPIAIALKDKLGEANVFYDSWSIKPGEGIIDRMNEGMTAPDFVFFFVSENSLARGCYGLGGVSDSSGIG